MTEKKNSKESKTKVLYIVFSIVASIALWMYVAYVQNPDKSVQRDDIKVEYVGEDVLRENNLIVTNIDTTTLALTFTGKRNTISKLDEQITATVDLAEIVNKYTATAGVYQLSYELDLGGVSQNAVSVSNSSKNYVSVTVEKLTSITVPVEVKNGVTAAEGYLAEEAKLSTTLLPISGPTSQLASVKCALVEITREDVTSAIVEDVPVTLVDADNNPVTSEYITLNQDTVTVTIPVLRVKEVKLTLDMINGASAQAEDVTVKMTPEYVTLSGDPAVMESLNELIIGEVDLTSFGTEMSKTFDFTVPAEYNNVSGETSAKAKLTIEGLSTKKIAVKDIQIRNAPMGSESTVKTKSVDIMIRGAKDILDTIKSENIQATVDLSEYQSAAGTVTVPVRVYLGNFGTVDVIGEYTVDVVIG